MCIKHNLAPESSAISFEITDGRFTWGGESDVTAAQLLAPEDTDRAPIEEAVTFLREILTDGPRLAAECIREATNNGISTMTLRRARGVLGCVVRRQGESGKRGGGAWWWELPSGLGVQEFPLENQNIKTDFESTAPTQPELAEHLNDLVCRDCGAPVDHYTDDGVPFCDLHWATSRSPLAAYGVERHGLTVISVEATA